MVVKVTDDPGQNGFALASMVTAGTVFVFKTIVTVSDMVGFPVTHVSEDVKMHHTISPGNGVQVKIGLFPLTPFAVFTFHWNAG